MESLKNKNVLLTGSSYGIGPTIAKALVKHGSNIALTARSESSLKKVASDMGKTGSGIMIIPTDLRDALQREKLVSSVRKEFGSIDVLVNNAGIESEGAFTELTLTALQENIEVNLVAPVALTRLVLPDMLSQRSGHIINISSIAARSGAPYAAIYSGTKAGLTEWSRALRLELEGTGVHFSTIFPGYVREAGMFARFGMQPPGLIGSTTPDQVARAVVKAIKGNKKEVVVNSNPVRYAFMMNVLFPAIGDWIMRVSGANDFQRRKVGK